MAIGQFVLHADQLVAGLQHAAPFGQVFQGAVDRVLQVGEVDWLGDEVEGAAVHGRANVGHVAVGGDDDGPDVRVHIGNLLQEGQAVHLGHVDVGDHHVDVPDRPQDLERLHPVAGKEELVLAAPDASAHALQDQRLEVGLVVDHQYLAGSLFFFHPFLLLCLRRVCDVDGRGRMFRGRAAGVAGFSGAVSSPPRKHPAAASVGDGRWERKPPPPWQAIRDGFGRPPAIRPPEAFKLPWSPGPRPATPGC